MQREAKEEIAEFIEKMSNVVSRLDSHFTMLEDLHFTANSKNREILEYSPQFFINVSEAFTRTSIIEVHNLFGKGNKVETSLWIMLKHICEYIREYENHDPDANEIKDFIAESNKKLNSLKKKMSKIRDYRNQVWGHRDTNYLDDPKEYFKKNPLYISELKEFLLTAKEICKGAVSLFSENKTSEIEIPGLDELKELFEHLNYYSKYRIRYGTAVLSEFDNEN
jgi:AbiU2